MRYLTQSHALCEKKLPIRPLHHSNSITFDTLNFLRIYKYVYTFYVSHFSTLNHYKFSLLNKGTSFPLHIVNTGTADDLAMPTTINSHADARSSAAMILPRLGRTICDPHQCFILLRVSSISSITVYSNKILYHSFKILMHSWKFYIMDKVFRDKFVRSNVNHSHTAHVLIVRSKLKNKILFYAIITWKLFI